MGDSGQLGSQEEPHDLNRKGLLSQGSNSIAMKSRVNREVQARFCERLEVKLLRPTRLIFGFQADDRLLGPLTNLRRGPLLSRPQQGTQGGSRLRNGP